MAAGRTLVVGGGIGGLAAALCLARSGREVTLLERAGAFTEAGAGIQLSPNASHVLHALGLQDALEAVGFAPERTEMRHWRSGKLLSATPLGAEARERFGAPYYHLHRGDLLATLLAAAEAEPAIELRTGAAVKAAEDAGDEALVHLEGSTERADLVVGADGIRSAVRASLFGPAEARFTGNVAWRALVPVERLPKDFVRPVTTAWWGPGRHFVHYYVRGGALVNCVCVVEKTGWEEESWTSRGDHRELVADFDGWHTGVRTLIDAMDPDACFKWALFDRDPMPQWSRGRLTLLGDACHPTLPFMAQGAAMAIEDAQVLANCLAASDDVVRALARYETLRRDRTARIQQGSRRNAKVFHLSGLAAWARNRAVQRAGDRVMDWLYEYDPTTVS